MQPASLSDPQSVKGFVVKKPSRDSKGLVCLRIEKNVETYPREWMIELKKHWHFFWFSAWNTPYKEIAYRDLIDIFITWDEHAAEIRASGRTDSIILRGGSETCERHDLMFHPIPAIERDIDLLYVARFTSRKRPDMALACVRFVAERNPATRSVFLESYASESALRTQIRQLAKDAGLTANLEFRTVLTDQVNGYMNRARLCLFTSDEEGLCRATLQTLLAERPLLAYRNTRALTRHLYDDRFFHFYEDQSPDSIGQTAWNLLCKPVHENPGARNYLLQEKGFVFHDLPGWQAELLAAAAPLYARDGQTLNHTDVIRVGAATSFILWRNFHLQRDPAR